MKSNKVDAFLHQTLSGKAKTDRAKILLEISKRPLTIENLVLKGWKIQTASARCSELEEMGLIKKMYNPNKSYSWFRFIEDENEREELRKKIENDKKARYFAKGLEKGYFELNENGLIVNYKFSL
jgi:hypothetical protein